jgi:hypothetical protein
MPRPVSSSRIRRTRPISAQGVIATFHLALATSLRSRPRPPTCVGTGTRAAGTAGRLVRAGDSGNRRRNDDVDLSRSGQNWFAKGRAVGVLTGRWFTGNLGWQCAHPTRVTNGRRIIVVGLVPQIAHGPILAVHSRIPWSTPTPSCIPPIHVLGWLDRETSRARFPVGTAPDRSSTCHVAAACVVWVQQH